jgi:uncharacterized protein (DUF433 family)
MIVATPIPATPAPRKLRYPHIARSAGVRGGKACIAGTRIAVVDIVRLQQWGMKPEEMLTYYSSRPLTLAEVHAALAYSYDHSEEIQAYFEREQSAEAEIEALKAEHRRRMPGA